MVVSSLLPQSFPKIKGTTKARVDLKDLALCRDAAVLSKASYNVAAKVFLSESVPSCHSIVEAAQANDLGDGLSYILAKSDKLDAVYVAVRGSRPTLVNWATNFSLNAAFEFEGRSGKVHNGFKQFAEKLPFAYLVEQASKGTTVVFTGHSLGGATASIGAALLMGRVSDTISANIRCVTFGAPMFGDAAFRDELQVRNQLKQFLHFVSEEDIVPLILGHTDLIQEHKILSSVLANMGIPPTVSAEVREILAPSFVPIGEFQFIRTGESAKEHMGQRLTAEKVTRLSALQQHSMTFYLQEMRSSKLFRSQPHCRRCVVRNNHDEDDPDTPELKDLSTETTVVRTEHAYSCTSRVGKLSENGSGTSLRFQLVGSVGFVEPLKEGDVFMVGQSCSFQFTKVLHTTTSLLYNIKVTGSPVAAGSKLGIALRSRFRAPPAFELVVNGSWFTSRQSTIKDDSIVALALQSRHIISAEVDHAVKIKRRDKNEAIEAAQKEFKPCLDRLDNWLNSALQQLDSMQSKKLRRIVHAVRMSDTKAAPPGIGLKAVGVLKSSKDEPMEDLLKIIGLEEGHTATEAQPMQNCFNNLALGGLRYDSVDAKSSTVLEAEVLTGVAFSLGFENLAQEAIKAERSGFLRSLAQKSGIMVGTGATAFICAAAAVAAFTPVGLVAEGFFILVFGVSMGVAGVGIVMLPFTAAIGLYALFAGSPFVSSLFLESTMLDEVEESGEGQNVTLHSRETKIGYWIGTESQWSVKVANKELKKLEASGQKMVSEFVELFVTSASSLRDLTLEKCKFNIGVVGQPGSGKTTLCSSLFEGIAYMENTQVPQVYSCSEHIFIKDYPGMLGTDAYMGARIELLRNTVHTLDAVVIVMKSMERSYELDKMLTMLRDKPIYVCLTQTDLQIQLMIDAQACKSKKRLTPLKLKKFEESAIANLKKWHTQFCSKYGLYPSSVHFLCPSAYLETKLMAYPLLKELPMLKRTGHVAEWLRSQAIRCDLNEWHVNDTIRDPDDGDAEDSDESDES